MKSSKRDNRIDAAKFLSILVVLINHSGIQAGAISFIGGMFYVPLFFVASGFTYHTSDESAYGFAAKKAKRLLIPYLITNAILAVIFAVLAFLRSESVVRSLAYSVIGTLYARSCFLKVPPYKQIMLNLNSPTWFLPALFLTVVFADLIERAKLKIRAEAGFKFYLTDSMVRWFLGGVLVIMGIYQICTDRILPWSLDMIPFFVILFFQGKYLREGEPFFKKLEFKKKALYIAVAVALLAYSAVANGSYNLSISVYGDDPFDWISEVFAMVCSVTSVFLLLCLLEFIEKKAPKVNGLLARGGRHTLFILCAHYPIMQIFIQAVGKFTGITSESGMSYQIVGALSIVVTLFICIIGDILLSKLIRKTEDRK